MTEAVWYCICGKPCELGECCSPKCDYIQSMMNTPFAQAMDDIDRVIDFLANGGIRCTEMIPNDIHYHR